MTFSRIHFTNLLSRELELESRPRTQIGHMSRDPSLI